MAGRLAESGANGVDDGFQPIANGVPTNKAKRIPPFQKDPLFCPPLQSSVLSLKSVAHLVGSRR